MIRIIFRTTLTTLGSLLLTGVTFILVNRVLDLIINEKCSPEGIPDLAFVSTFPVPCQYITGPTLPLFVAAFFSIWYYTVRKMLIKFYG